MNRTLASLLAGSLLVTVSTACGDTAADAVSTCHGQTLNIGASTAANLQYSAAYVADKKGYLKEEKINAKTVELGGGSETLQALAGGSIDAAATTFAAVVTAVNKGAPLVAIASTANRNTADIGIRSDKAPAAGADLETAIRALKGLRVAVTSPGSGSDQTLRYLVKSSGLDPDKDLSIVATGGASETVAAFARGSVDAFVIGPPASYIAAEQGDGEVALKLASGVAPSLDNLLYGTIVTSERTLAEKRNPLRCYVRAIDKAVRYIHDHPAEAGDLLRPQFEGQMSDRQFALSWTSIVQSTPASAAIVPAEALKAAKFVEVVTGAGRIDAEKAYDTTFTKDLT
ncbi:ABC transporter substrate-binding protein [Microtetraspora fusca]|uniref:ABC transporter substrate-binding protein n=1 Tax=Microtetraspora fusca TaxID=1997 RepID=A0ABW6VIP0_MICFU|nr:ABC transporter substrate-binding protein [Microtetraspora fusca]